MYAASCDSYVTVWTTDILPRSDLISVFCSSVTAPLAQLGSDSASLLLQRKIETLTLSYQYPFIVLTWSLIRSDPPNRASDKATETMTAKVIVRLRRRPTPISDRTNWARMAASSGLSVNVCGAGGQCW
ncbi:hypothetical protein SALBM311S_06690 [Streptomyces alboniger]